MVFVSIDVGETWIPLHDFVNEEDPAYNEQEALFLEHQLDLLRKLCYVSKLFVIQMFAF